MLFVHGPIQSLKTSKWKHIMVIPILSYVQAVTTILEFIPTCWKMLPFWTTQELIRWSKIFTQYYLKWPRPWRTQQKKSLLWFWSIHFHTSPITGSVYCCTSCLPLRAIVIHLFKCWTDYIHCGSTAFRCCLALLVQATDRQANIPNWMCAASFASRDDPDRSLQISVLSLICYACSQTSKMCSLLLSSSVPMFFTLFSYPALHQLLSLSLPISHRDWEYCTCSSTKYGSAAEVEFIISFIG